MDRFLPPTICTPVLSGWTMSQGREAQRAVLAVQDSRRIVSGTLVSELPLFGGDSRERKARKETQTDSIFFLISISAKG